MRGTRRISGHFEGGARRRAYLIEHPGSGWWRSLPNSVPQYVREVLPAPCVFRRTRADMEFQPDAILPESNKFCRLVRHHGLRRVSARPFNGSRPPDAVSVLLPRLLPDAQNTGRAAGSNAPGSSVGRLR